MKRIFEKNVIFASLMEFFREILKEALKESEELFEGFDNINVSEIINIMKENDMFDKTPVKVGMFETSEKEYIEKLHIPKNNNDELYDFCYWLNSKGYLEKYLSQKICKKPEMDRFYDDMNEKLFGIAKETVVNTNHKCPFCGMVPYYSFNTVCSHCREKLSKYKFDDCLSSYFVGLMIKFIDDIKETDIKESITKDFAEKQALMRCLEYLIKNEYVKGSEKEELIRKVYNSFAFIINCSL